MQPQPPPKTPGWLAIIGLTCLCLTAVCFAGFLTTALHFRITRPRQKGPTPRPTTTATPPEPTKRNPTMTTNRLARAITVFHAWMEDSDMFDGNALYLDLDTAKQHAAYDYEGDEYGHFDDEDEDDEPHTTPDFTWENNGGNYWHLIDHGQDTRVRISERTVWRPATPREIQQQDALTAAEKAARAAQPQRPLAEALEAGARAAARPAV